MSPWHQIAWIVLVTALVMAILVALTGAESRQRPYSRVSIEEAVATFGHPPHTHVCVSGRVANLKREIDGDLHVMLEDSAGRRLVAEEIPGLRARGPRPALGQMLTACGISRWDGKHAWPEIHPVEEYRR